MAVFCFFDFFTYFVYLESNTNILNDFPPSVSSDYLSHKEFCIQYNRHTSKNKEEKLDVLDRGEITSTHK